MSQARIEPDILSTRLSKFFAAVIDGKRAIKNTNDAKIFLDSICNQSDRSSCIEKLVAATHGLQAVKISLRSDVSSNFINESSVKFLAYIANDNVRLLCNGQLLQQVLVIVTEPPTFWNALEKCYDDRSLTTLGIHTFAVTVLELLRSPSPSVQLDISAISENFSVAAKAYKTHLTPKFGRLRIISS